MRNRYNSVVVRWVAVGVMGISLCGCKKKEPLKPFEKKLYEHSKIAFASNRDGNTEIYIMNADGSEQNRLTSNPASEGYPSWPPDGKKIAFESISSRGNTDIYVMNADGTQQTRLTSNPRVDGYCVLERKAHEAWSQSSHILELSRQLFVKVSPCSVRPRIHKYSHS